VGQVSEGPKTKRFEFIDEHQNRFGVRYLCKRLSVSFQGYYQWCSREPSLRVLENKVLSKEISAIYEQHKGNYGSPRIHAELRDRGSHVNHKRVARLMSKLGLVGKAGRLYRRKRLAQNSCISVSNRQRERGMPSKVNKQWVGDVTYLKLNGEWRYLAVVLDLYSRKLVGWALSKTRTSNLTLRALNQAAKARTLTSGMIFHSDRGSEYGAHVYQQRLKQLGIEPSMNRPGYMNDNVYVESFFQSLKTECYKGIRFKSDSELMRTMSWYLDDYYNKVRRHGALGFKAPDIYETIMA